MQQLCLVWRTGAGPWLWNTTLAVRNGSGVAIEIFVCGPEPSLIEPLPQLRPGEVRVYDAVTATLICGGVFAFRDGIDL
ncbi:MAG TPA: hypothetical protein VNL91_06020, partial [Thermoanaerobaculia bacterium]|nr:hypothetical protein [Thermoanaerobaculia bacterium]